MKIQVYGEVEIDADAWREGFAAANPGAERLSDDNIRAAMANGFAVLYGGVPHVTAARAIFIPDLWPDMLVKPVGIVNPGGRIVR